MQKKTGLNAATVARWFLYLAVMAIAGVASTALAQDKPVTPGVSMTKIIAVYRIPRDPTEFDRYYAQVHTPLVKKMPGLRRLEVTKITGVPSGASDLYQIAELYFEGSAAREAALASNEGKAVVADLPKFAEGIVSVYFGEGREP
jgi:uncharacterized protein (TIGR02118 family)